MKDVIEFYPICHHIVRAWPATYPDGGTQEYRALRLNSFAVLRSLQDLDSDNLNRALAHAIGKPYFYARSFASDDQRPESYKIDFPLMGLAEDSFTITNALGGYKQDRQRLNVFFIDQLPGEANNYTDPYSSQRTIEEVGRDLRLLARQFFTVLARWQNVEFPNDEYADGWHDVGYIEAENPGIVIEMREEIDQVLQAISPAQGDLIYMTGSNNMAVLILNIEVATEPCTVAPAMAYDYGEDGTLQGLAERFTNDV